MPSLTKSEINSLLKSEKDSRYGRTCRSKRGGGSGGNGPLYASVFETPFKGAVNAAFEREVRLTTVKQINETQAAVFDVIRNAKSLFENDNKMGPAGARFLDSLMSSLNALFTSAQEKSSPKQQLSAASPFSDDIDEDGEIATKDPQNGSPVVGVPDIVSLLLQEGISQQQLQERLKERVSTLTASSFDTFMATLRKSEGWNSECVSLDDCNRIVRLYSTLGQRLSASIDEVFSVSTFQSHCLPLLKRGIISTCESYSFGDDDEEHVQKMFFHFKEEVLALIDISITDCSSLSDFLRLPRGTSHLPVLRDVQKKLFEIKLLELSDKNAERMDLTSEEAKYLRTGLSSETKLTRARYREAILKTWLKKVNNVFHGGLSYRQLKDIKQVATALRAEKQSPAGSSTPLSSGSKPIHPSPVLPASSVSQGMKSIENRMLGGPHSPSCMPVDSRISLSESRPNSPLPVEDTRVDTLSPEADVQPGTVSSSEMPIHSMDSGEAADSGTLTDVDAAVKETKRLKSSFVDAPMVPNEATADKGNLAEPLPDSNPMYGAALIVQGLRSQVDKFYEAANPSHEALLALEEQFESLYGHHPESLLYVKGGMIPYLEVFGALKGSVNKSLAFGSGDISTLSFERLSEIEGRLGMYLQMAKKFTLLWNSVVDLRASCALFRGRLSEVAACVEEANRFFSADSLSTVFFGQDVVGILGDDYANKIYGTTKQSSARLQALLDGLEALEAEFKTIEGAVDSVAVIGKIERVTTVLLQIQAQKEALLEHPLHQSGIFVRPDLSRPKGVQVQPLHSMPQLSSSDADSQELVVERGDSDSDSDSDSDKEVACGKQAETQEELFTFSVYKNKAGVGLTRFQVQLVLLSCSWGELRTMRGLSGTKLAWLYNSVFKTSEKTTAGRVHEVLEAEHVSRTYVPPKVRDGKKYTNVSGAPNIDDKIRSRIPFLRFQVGDSDDYRYAPTKMMHTIREMILEREVFSSLRLSHVDRVNIEMAKERGLSKYKELKNKQGRILLSKLDEPYSVTEEDLLRSCSPVVKSDENAEI
jgi:hypothetical protein